MDPRQKIRLAHVIATDDSTVFKNDLTGCPGDSSLSIVNNLDPHRYTNYVLTHSGGELTDHPGSVGCIVKYIPIGTISRKNSLPFLICILRSLFFFILNRIRLAHFQFHTDHYPVLVAAKLAHVATVIHMRGTPSEFERAWLSHADRLVFNSRFAADLANLSPPLQAKTTVIHSAVESQDFLAITPLQREEVLKSMGLKPGKKTVGCVSRIHPVKGVERFVELASRLVRRDDIQFVVVGDVQDEEYAKRVRNLIEGLGLKGKLVLAGHRRDMRYVYRSLDALVHAAYDEPFGRILIEAAASDLPVIAFDSGVVPEVITDNVTGLLVQPGDVKGMVAHVEKVLDDGTVRRRLIESAQGNVRENFGSIKHASKIETLYMSLLGT